MKKENCPQCQYGEYLAKFGYLAFETETSSVIVFKDQSHKGRMIVSYKKDHVAEIQDLSDEERNAFMKDVSDVAKAVGKSESTVKKLFADYHGIIKYYNSLKIKEAKRLIREERYNISQISDMLCFDTPQYFSKCFRSFTGMSPLEYKRSLKSYTPPVNNTVPVRSPRT